MHFGKERRRLLGEVHHAIVTATEILGCLSCSFNGKHSHFGDCGGCHQQIGH